MIKPLLRSIKTLFCSALILGIPFAGNATVHNVNVSDFTFTPAVFNGVVVGDTIHWMWVSGVHTTTSTSIPAGAASWDAPITSTNTSFMYKVTMPGTYNYFCSVHPTMMTASFTVTSPAGIANSTTTGYMLNLLQNPVRTTAKFEVKSPAITEAEISFFDVTGKLAFQQKSDFLKGVNQIEIPVAELKSGLYFVTVITPEKNIGTIKMIRQ